jgi:beta-lactamase regulating signal transducer with metallopeptidase domain
MMVDYAAAMLALLLDWIAKGFVVLGFAFLADLLLRRASASLRHLIWLVALAAVMLLPAASWVLPSLDVPLFHLGFLTVHPIPGNGAVPLGTEVGVGWSTSEILLAVYLAGVLLVFAWQLVGRAYAYRLRKQAGRIAVGSITRELQRLKTALGIHNPVDLLSSELISIPFSTGYFRPVIVLPKATSSWPSPVLESVLTHELAHIKRKDILARIAVQLSCCIHWINPLAWYGFGRIMMEQEIACDNLVLSTGTKASDYARNLLVLSQVRRGTMDFALTALGRRTELKGRLLEILAPTRNRAPLRIGGALLFVVLTFGLLLPVSALNVWDPSDAGLSGSSVGPSPRPLAPAQLAGQGQTPQFPPKPPPDLIKFKESLAKKIQEMKGRGASEDEIKKYTMSAKAKLETLQLEKRKQEEKNKQIEGMRVNEGKRVK